jgi:hypothetical protein
MELPNNATFKHMILQKPNIAVLLVNQQFSAEYKDTQKGSFVVEIRQHAFADGENKIPSAFTKAPTLQISWLLGCLDCCGMDRVRGNSNTFAEITDQMPTLQKVHIYLYLDPDFENYTNLLELLPSYQSMAKVGHDPDPQRQRHNGTRPATRTMIRRSWRIGMLETIVSLNLRSRKERKTSCQQRTTAMKPAILTTRTVTRPTAGTATRIVVRTAATTARIWARTEPRTVIRLKLW